MPIVRALALDLVDVECSGQGARTLVRVFIDKPAGVTLEDCEQVHVSLGHALDVQDPIPHAYTLEVSSPGLDRPLKRREDWARSVGKLVSVKLRQPLEGQWRLLGRLQGVDEQGITLSLTGTERRVEWGAVADGRLEVEF
ncbi:ribosome maturation factor RimP [Candidatus Nitrospira bockiana]